MPVTESSTLGVYVSIPFCRAKCSYCNFASGVFGRARMDAYVDRLVSEIGAAREEAQKWGAALPVIADSIYFGGGTPSLLSPQQMKEIMNAIHEAFSLAQNAEMTLECAPGQLSDALLSALPELGFNRASLGVQSFVNREAAAVGRLHTAAVAHEEIARLRRAGMEDINVDLIAGLPHQTLKSWRDSLDSAIASGVPHLSVYMLDVDEDSRLGREMLAGGERYHVGEIPDEQAIAAMYGVACEDFAAHGIAQYEISNFARAGLASRHNLKYWTRQPYIGYGLDAHSFLETHEGGAVRVAGTDDLTAYLDQAAPEIVTPVSSAEAVEEAWFLGLRLSAGVSLSKMETEIGPEAMRVFQPALMECEREGLLESADENVRLTARGKLFANEVFTRFMGVLTEDQIEEGVLA